ncbi:MAG: hypothetical protein HYX94_08635 [Chloroflexi bacterium]|nr:hypothetical protein [Chloroflexota bacterium]
MFVAGIDAGRQTTKAVVLADSVPASHAIVGTSETAEGDSRKALEEACSQAGITPEDIGYTVITGALRKQVIWAQAQRSPESCLAKGAYSLFASCKMAIDVGAEGFLVVKIGRGGTQEDSAGNDRCASGAGVFFETMTKYVLRLAPEEMTRLGMESDEIAEITSTCAIFAEQEVISHIHRVPPTPLPQVVGGIYSSIVNRVVGVAKRLLIEPDIALAGGLAKDAAFVYAVERAIGRKTLVPDTPQIVSALGAALVAQERALRDLAQSLC